LSVALETEIEMVLGAAGSRRRAQIRRERSRTTYDRWVFATLLGALPSPPLDEGGEELDELVRIAIRAQEAAGLEPITDGRLRNDSGLAKPATVVAAWKFAAGETDRAVKQALPGPYSIGWRLADGADAADRSAAADRAVATERAAEELRAIVAELAAAGCPLIEIEETDAHRIGEDPVERALFAEAHGRLTDGVQGTHLSLSIVGGSAWGAGSESIFDLPYASLAVDLIDGPNNWNLVTRLPGDRGVIAGALPAKDSPADAKETLLWAARYAAASNGRGLDRVGIGSAGSWASLTWEAAVSKMHHLGEAARLASTPGGADLARELDPRAVSARAGATGQVGRTRPAGQG
jgi:hypothetical protein